MVKSCTLPQHECNLSLLLHDFRIMSITKYKVELHISTIYPFIYKHRSINKPMNNYFHTNDYQLLLKLKKVGYRRCDGCLYEELGMLSYK